jgi:hypothetical protein
MIPQNGTFQHLFTAKFSEGLIIVPTEATHFIISANKSIQSDFENLNYASIRVLPEGVINPYYDCIIPAGEFLPLLFGIKNGISGLTYTLNNTEPELISFYKYQINRRIQ